MFSDPPIEPDEETTRKPNTSRVGQIMGLGVAGVAAFALIGGVTWLALHAPPAQDDADVTDQPCGYYPYPNQEPYPYLPTDGRIPEEPTYASEHATQLANGYPGSVLGDESDYVDNATRYAIYLPTSQAHATRCAGVNADQRQTEVAQRSGLGPTPLGQASPTPSITMTAAPYAYPGAVLTEYPTVDPLETSTLTPTTTRTITPQPTETLAAPAPNLVAGDPASAGLRFIAIGALWQLDQTGTPRRVVDLPQFVSNVRPDGHDALSVEAGDLYISDLATGSQTNLTADLDTQEESAIFWPARPDTVVRVFYGPVDGEPGVHLQLGTLALDGSAPSSLGVLGDLGRANFALGDDGDTIAFIQDLDIVLVRMSDGARRILTLAGLGLSSSCDRVLAPGLSPDLGALAMRCLLKTDSGGSDEAVLIVDRGTGLGRLLDRHAVGDSGREGTGWPVLWSPDGSNVLVAERTDNALNQRVVRVADGALMATLPGRVQVFSPDGQWAVVQAALTDSPAPWFLVDTATWSTVVPIAVPDIAGDLSWPGP